MSRAEVKVSSIALRDLAGFIFDMDGVIYRGNAVLPGAAEFVAGLRRARVPFIFLTNNSTTPPDKVAARLTGMGIAAEPTEVLTSAEVTAATAATQVKGRRALLIGEEGIRRALLAQGFSLVECHTEADLVVVGLDRECTYARLREAALAIERGAPFYATNLDRNLPTEIGLIPGAGALVAALEIATGVKATSIGKPEPGIFTFALGQLGTQAEVTAAIGDRPETDILGGQQAGLHTVAVLTGAGTAEAFAAMRPGPDWVFEDLAALSRAYFGEL
jgi:4-nitrophenyl phosphatase